MQAILPLSTTQIIFLVIVALMIVQRLLELRHSNKNEAIMLAAGGREHSPAHFQFMKAVHTLWFVAMLAEVLLFAPARGFFVTQSWHWWLAGGALIATLLGQTLRYAAIRTLGTRWSVRIMTVPDSPAVSGGVYRFIRHPNYLGVILEIAAVPLLHGAFLTSIGFTLLNALVLWIRIRAEEQALRDENEYAQRLGDRARFVALTASRESGESGAGQD